MPFDWSRALVGGLGGLGGDPMFMQKIDAAAFDKQYKQFQMQQALEKLKMEKETHDVESKYRAALMKKMEQEFKNTEQENKPLGTDFVIPETTPPTPGSETTMMMDKNLGDPNQTPWNSSKYVETPGKPTGNVDWIRSLGATANMPPKRAEEARKILETLHKTLVPEKKNTEKLGQGDILVDPVTGKKIAEGNPKPTTEKNVQWRRYSTDYGDKIETGYYNPEDPTQKKDVETKQKGKLEGDTSKEDRATGKDAMALRKEFNNLKEVKDYKDVRSKFDIMKSAYKEAQNTNNFVATDQTLINIFNRMVDPNSVVRPSEYMRTAEDLSFINKMRGKVDKILSGGAGLTNDERTALMDMSTKFISAYEKYYGNSAKEYRGYATGSKLDPDMVVKEEQFPEDRRILNGKFYIKKNGTWYQE